jgi:hypothetical protein
MAICASDWAAALRDVIDGADTLQVFSYPRNVSINGASCKIPLRQIDSLK